MVVMQVLVWLFPHWKTKVREFDMFKVCVQTTFMYIIFARFDHIGIVEIIDVNNE